MDENRLAGCMKRTSEGKALTVGFLGGSITQDSLASKHEYGYAYRTYLWFREKFPRAEISYVNAGIGGTSSLYGVSRVEKEMLIYQPDLVFVDFSVNDGATDFFMETYEGLIRRLLFAPSAPSVVLLCNARYDNGLSAEEKHGMIGDYYGLPRVSIGSTIYQRILSKELAASELSPDGLHPNDRGHALVAGEIIRLLEDVWQRAQKTTPEQSEGVIQEEEHSKENRNLKCGTFRQDPLTTNAYEKALRLTIENTVPKRSGFLVDPREKMGHLDHFKNGWIGKNTGDSISFRVEASCIAVQYRKSVQHPARRAELILDGESDHPVLLDGNFEEDWGDCLYMQSILHHGIKKEHTVTIRILPEDENGKNATIPFYLMSLVIA